MQITIREPGSAITHLIGMILALISATPLLVKAAGGVDRSGFIGLAVFIGSMVALYGASALYHSLSVRDSLLRTFRKLDHMMIFVLIAGSYTPVCLVILGEGAGYALLAAVWAIAVLGMAVKLCWITCPKWFSSLFYTAMGWTCLSVLGTLWNALSRSAFLWLLAGGLIYTAGGVIYALKLPLFNARHRHFGSHEIFHLFVMGGSVCHFVFMYRYVA